MQSDRTRLERLGFVPTGHWRLDGKQAACELVGPAADLRAVYAFVLDGYVKYVGICDGQETSLRKRMRRYKNEAGAGTNKRVLRLIREALMSGSKVEV